MTRGTKTLDALLFAAVFVVTFAKLRLSTPAGELYLSEITATAFVVGFVALRLRARDWGVSHVAGGLTVFLAAFLAIYLIGFFNLDTVADRNQFAKGLAKFLVHFAFLVAAVAYLSRRSARLYWQTLAWFVAGFAANAAYGLAQLGLAETTGGNLDELVLGALGLYERGGINVYGSVGSQSVYRTTALTLDPNHLGVMLVVPIVVLLPLYLRLPREHRLRNPVAALLVFLALVELTTLSRSGLLGIAVGLLVLAIPYRHLLLRSRLLVPAVLFAGLVAVAVLARSDFFRTVLEARTQTGGNSSRVHFEFYSLVAPAFGEHPLFGLGLNTFSTYYELQTGRTNWGPHSFYVALLTETGVVGTLLFAGYLTYLFRLLGRARRLGRSLAAHGSEAGTRLRPLAWGFTAALAGTMAANAFYLTMQMYYFFAFVVLAVAAPLVARRP